MNNINEYLIHESNFPAFEEKVEKLNKKAIKLNFPAITFEILETVVNIDEKTKRAENFFKIILNGESPKLNGWKFIARLETIKEQKHNLVFVIPNENIPLAYRESGSQCQHCNSKRYRKYTYVLMNENGEYKQVGSSCLKDFLGHTDPHNYAKYLEWMEQLTVCAKEGETVDRGSISSHDCKYELDYFVYYVAEYIKQTGYFLSKSKAEQLERSSTGDLVWNEMFNRMMKQNDKIVQSISDESIELANKAIEWAKELGNKEKLNDYQHNLYLSCMTNLVDYRSKGIVASLITAYQYDLELIKKKEVEKQEKSSSQYFGTIGEREIFTLTVVKKSHIESYYGSSILHVFEDENGNIATWFSSNKEFEEGETVTIKATVKEHKEYRDQKQTILTRCTEVKKSKKVS